MLRKIRNIVLTFYLMWSAGIGVLILGIITALSSLTLTTAQIFLYGALGGIAMGLMIGGLILFALVRKLRRYRHLFFIFQGARAFLRNRRF